MILSLQKSLSRHGCDFGTRVGTRVIHSFKYDGQWLAILVCDECHVSASMALGRLKAASPCKCAHKNHTNDDMREYHVWKEIRYRCQDPKHKFYSEFGAKGATVDPAWEGKEGFPNFLKSMGRKPSGDGHAIDRINPTKPFGPGNCRWVPSTECKEKGWLGTTPTKYAGHSFKVGDVFNGRTVTKLLMSDRGACCMLKCTTCSVEIQTTVSDMTLRPNLGCNNCNISNLNKTHGQSHKTPEWVTWASMHRRCYNVNTADYAHYGARGITVDPRWHGPDGFMTFFKDMGLRPSDDHSIDRIDTNGPYSPENCRWATAKEQARNKTNNLILTVKGESKTLAEWAEQYYISSDTIRSRLRYGWSEEDAVTTPVRI